MPFGLRNSGQTFQHLIDHATRGLDFAFVNLNDMLVTSPDHKTHKKHLKILFKCLPEYGIKIGPEKCHFGTTELSFFRTSASRAHPPSHHRRRDS